jgi:hypothetical protein
VVTVGREMLWSSYDSWSSILLFMESRLDERCCDLRANPLLSRCWCPPEHCASNVDFIEIFFTRRSDWSYWNRNRCPALRFATARVVYILFCLNICRFGSVYEVAFFWNNNNVIFYYNRDGQ